MPQTPPAAAAQNPYRCLEGGGGGGWGREGITWKQQWGVVYLALKALITLLMCPLNTLQTLMITVVGYRFRNEAVLTLRLI